MTFYTRAAQFTNDWPIDTAREEGADGEGKREQDWEGDGEGKGMRGGMGGA